MPQMLAKLLGAEVFVHARGGARLAEQLNPETKMGARTVQALQEHHYDYVVLQEMSHGPATAPERYKDSVRKLVGMIREADAEPVLYATWAFRPGCEKLARLGMDADEMHQRMQQTVTEISEEYELLVANVGEAFFEQRFAEELYAPDGVHPSESGSRIAAEIIAEVIRSFEKPGLSEYDGQKVRVTLDNGDSFTGTCGWFPSGFGEAELGTAEEGLQIRRRVFFASQIIRVEVMK